MKLKYACKQATLTTIFLIVANYHFFVLILKLRDLLHVYIVMEIAYLQADFISLCRDIPKYLLLTQFSLSFFSVFLI